MSDDWRSRAACRKTTSPEIFFPRHGSTTRAALRYCRVCPVRRACLESQLDKDIWAQWGIWGGTTPAQRQRLIRLRRECAS